MATQTGSSTKPRTTRTPRTRLEELRRQRQPSRVELAAVSGVSFDTIGRIERCEGKARPHRGTLILLAAALGAEPAELLAPPEDLEGRGDP